MSCIIAYIDPTSGGLLVQLLFAGFAGIAVFCKTMRGRVVRFFKGKSKQSEDEDES